MKPDLSALPGITLVGDEPVFSEPWQAQAFAMTVSLHEKGAFTWNEWAGALSEQVHGGTDRDYYNHWLAALENLVAEKNITSPGEIDIREQDWHTAAARTPHGKTIEL